MVALMSISYYFSLMGLGTLMLAPAVFAFGLVAFGFLGMGPVTMPSIPTVQSRTTRSPFTSCR